METNASGNGRQYMVQESPNVWRAITNPREEAILDVLGGRVQARIKLNMTRQAVHQILTGVDRVKDVESAERIAKATAEAGREVPAVELLGLAPWRGPDRHGTDPERKQRRKAGPKPSSPSRALVAVPRANEAAAPIGSLRTARIVRPAKQKRGSAPPERSACKAQSIPAISLAA